MGRGKSSAAMRYMNEHKDDKRFLYITPFLSEVERVCHCCDFIESPNDSLGSKSLMLKMLLRSGVTVAATHALFYLLDDEARQLLHDRHYTLIIDESISLIGSEPVSPRDIKVLLGSCMTEVADHRLIWTDKEYNGKFNDLKFKVETGSLYGTDLGVMKVANPDILRTCDDVYMLTYMFDGQYQSAYLKYFDFAYKVVGIEEDEKGYRFSDKPDDPPPVDYSRLIHIVDSPKMNAVGDGQYALSKAWFARHSRKSPEIQQLKKSMTNFFKHKTKGGFGSRMWTTFKDHKDKLGGSDGSFKWNFVQISARAMNNYSERTNLAYMANRFCDPNIRKFFARKDIIVDDNMFALTEMLQWIWRSAIRNDEEIWLYIPSSRMRAILKNWIAEVSRT